MFFFSYSNVNDVKENSILKHLQRKDLDLRNFYVFGFIGMLLFSVRQILLHTFSIDYKETILDILLDTKINKE